MANQLAFSVPSVVHGFGFKSSHEIHRFTQQSKAYKSWVIKKTEGEWDE
ncbi:MAG: hypothetical protein Q9M31_03530 [Mariprofundus sp.]|nr:hypothetical protein [Mariprofundus sp.]